MQEALLMALALNRVRFVKLLLDHGIDVKTAMNIRRLEFLYGYWALKGGYLDLTSKKEEGHVKVERIMKLLCSYEENAIASECFVPYQNINEKISALGVGMKRNDNTKVKML